jgi:hypothetical protein
MGLAGDTHGRTEGHCSHASKNRVHRNPPDNLTHLVPHFTNQLWAHVAIFAIPMPIALYLRNWIAVLGVFTYVAAVIVALGSGDPVRYLRRAGVGTLAETGDRKSGERRIQSHVGSVTRRQQARRDTKNR